MKTISPYWKESVESALDEMGRWKDFTPEEIEKLADYMERAASMESEYTGTINIPDPRTMEVEDLKRKLKYESEKVVCPECLGKGRIISSFGPAGRVSDSQCNECHGEGKIHR